MKNENLQTSDKVVGETKANAEVSKPEDRTREMIDRARKARSGSNVLEDRLSVPQAVRDAYPDCVFFWENNEEGAVERRMLKGWEVVKVPSVDGEVIGNDSNMGSTYSMPVGRGNTTGNLQAILMALPRELYEEDIKAQEKQSREITDSRRRKPSDHGIVNPDGSYAPKLPSGKIGFDQKFGLDK